MSYIFTHKYVYFYVGVEVTDPFLAPIVEAMRENFLKYWEEIPKVTIVANILHPTYKLHYTVRMVKKYKTYLGLPRGTEEPELRALIEEMFTQYNTRRNTAQPTASTSFRYIFLQFMFFYNLLFCYNLKLIFYLLYIFNISQ